MSYNLTSSIGGREPLNTAVFEAMPGNCYLLQTDAPRYTILATTAQFLKLLGLQKQDIVGKSLFDCFPSNQGDLRNRGEGNLRASLAHVLQRKESHELPVQRHDVAGANGRVAECYWRAENRPVLGPDGEVAFVVHTVEDITDQRQAEAREVQLECIERSFGLFMHAPMIVALVNGDDHVLEIANQEALTSWGKGPEIIGKPILQGVPELESQGIIKLFDHVRTSGQAYFAYEVPVTSSIDGRENQRYLNLVYQPYHSKGSPEPTGVFTFSHDITEQVQAKQKAQESEEAVKRFQFMADNAHDLFILMRKDGTFAYLNKKALDVWGYTEEEAKSIRVPDIDPHYHDEAFAEVFARAQEGEKLQLETLHKRKDGRMYPVEVNMNGITLEGKPHLFAVARNITARKKAEADLRESEARFRNMVEQAPMAITLTRSQDVVIESINAPMLQLMNKCSREEVLGKTMLEVLPELKGQPALQTVLNVQNTGIPFRGDEQPVDLLVNGELKRHYFDFSYTPVVEAGKTTSVLHVAVDVTEQVLAKRKIEESEGRFRLLADASPNLIWMLHPDGSYAYVNKTTLEFLGITQEHIAAVGWEVFQHPDDLEPARQAITKAVQNKESYELEHRLHHKNGEYRWVLSQALPAYDANGSVFAYVGSSIEIHESKMAQQALLESETRFRTMAESTPVLIAVADETGNSTYFNKAWTDLTGRPMPQLLEFGWVDLVHPEDKERILHVLLRASNIKGPFTGEFRVLSTKGEHCWLLAHGVPRVKADGSFAGHISACTDITEQKRSQRELQTALEQVRLSKEAAELGTFDMDLEKGTLDWDDRCRTLFGVSHQEPVTYEKDFLKGLHPDDRERIVEVIQQSFNRSISNGDYDVEYRTVRAEDGLTRWVRAKGKVYFNREAKPIRFIGSVLDITEQVTAIQGIENLVKERTKELAQANESLLQANKELQRSNANLEEFAHAASHDLKEPVRKIYFFTSLLKNQLNTHLRDEQAKAFSRIEHATQRMGNLIDDLLLYSHVSQKPHEMESVDLNQRVQGVLEDLELGIEEKAAKIAMSKLPVVKGFPRQLQQLFQNLISNSVKYSKADEPPHIAIHAMQVTENGRLYHEIAVQDNGIGFEPEYSDKIFQLFARLHGRAQYSGTGVGLSIVKKVVENHDGMIKVESSPGHGATFRIYLPVEP